MFNYNEYIIYRSIYKYMIDNVDHSINKYK